MGGKERYSCESAAQTAEWIDAIVRFLKPHTPLLDAHLVNFLKDRLWESVDKDWMDCLRHEPLQNLLLIPSGLSQDHWPDSLKDFLQTLSSISFPRQQLPLDQIFPGIHLTSLNTVLAQGMNAKKKHEIQVLSALVDYIAKKVGAQTIVDVGAGQGYLAQVLSFQYNHSVAAIDACDHHGKVTDARAERIMKHYANQMRKSGSEIASLRIPRTITCQVSSTEILKALSDISIHDNVKAAPFGITDDCAKDEQLDSYLNQEKPVPILLAGLHACGDLSVTLLRTFVESEEVAAVISIGCCYNLLSEAVAGHVDTRCGFPLSKGYASTSLSLGKSARDLACQSADRWRSLEIDAGLHNFELHAFRAAFQMVLFDYFPETAKDSPPIGRQGKTMRRRQKMRMMNSSQVHRPSLQTLFPRDHDCEEKNFFAVKSVKVDEDGISDSEQEAVKDMDITRGMTLFRDKSSDFRTFSLSALHRLGLQHSVEIDFDQIWKDMEPFTELLGPYWSLRAALGSVLETLILLDRLLFLQEQGRDWKAFILPVFDPSLSPRNLAIVAAKVSDV
ncbi:hypothetical protein MLD38_034130 [Melastoma candidum]|uniref:Uncharacterized protein n=1 Tax=Melastoma candidum TaxID=119954 RepID=A0ACB9M9J1_9MYRT|nr:hypothetical protein MLD38_034130 [Melastoma candidum]